ILGGFAGERAMGAFSEAYESFAEKKPRYKGYGYRWDELAHPRGPNGRFIKRGSPEATASAHDALETLRQGDHSPDAVRQAAEHLGILTGKQLRELQAKHGLKAWRSRYREDLIKAISERLPGHEKARKMKAEEEADAKRMGPVGGGGEGGGLPPGQPVGGPA